MKAYFLFNLKLHKFYHWIWIVILRSSKITDYNLSIFSKFFVRVTVYIDGWEIRAAISIAVCFAKESTFMALVVLLENKLLLKINQNF